MRANSEARPPRRLQCSRHDDLAGAASVSHDIAARLDFGTVWVNSHLVLASEVPWGGFKGSGYGRDLSVYALDDYSRTKHVMHNWTREGTGR